MNKQQVTVNLKEWLKNLKECGWDSKAEFLWIYVLGGCGCGSSDHLGEIALEVLTLFATQSDTRWDKIYNDKDAILYETIAHWLDSLGLIEHGTSIAGAWLSEEGQELYDAISKAPESSDDLHLNDKSNKNT